MNQLEMARPAKRLSDRHSMAITQTDIDALTAAIVQGAKYVRIGDRLIEFRTQAELFAALKWAQDQVSQGAPATTSPNLIVPTFSKTGNTSGSGSGPASGGGGPWY